MVSWVVRSLDHIQRFIIRLKQSPHVSYYSIRWSGEPEDDEGRGSNANPSSQVDNGDAPHDADNPQTIRRPLHILWVFRKQEKQWKRFPYRALIDATYRTNYKSMPLVIGIALTPEKIAMPLFQAVINNEGADGYSWLVQTIQKALLKLTIPAPYVLITDGDKELISAITRIFPRVARQRCIFHLNNNIILFIKKH